MAPIQFNWLIGHTASFYPGRRTSEQENVIAACYNCESLLRVSIMDATGWQPIEMAPPETRIWLGLIENGRLKRVGLGRITA
jgi:hypothetical protein